MSTINFSQPRGGCDVTLAKFLVEADPSQDAVTYKLYVVLPLASRAEAESAESMLPGLADAFDRAGEDDNWKSTLSVKPSDSLRVVLAAKEAAVGTRQGVVKPGETVIQGQAELVEVKATQSKRAKVILVRFVFRGQAPAVAERLVDNLNRNVAMTFERAQGVLDFKAPAKVPQLRVGMVVAASLSDGLQVVGRVMEIDGGTLSLQERGTEHSVEREAVISAYSFSDDSETSAALTDYAERCRRRGAAVSWAELTNALVARSGRAESASLPTPVQVTSDDVEDAVERIVGLSEMQQPEQAQDEVGPPIVTSEASTKGRKPRAAARA